MRPLHALRLAALAAVLLLAATACAGSETDTGARAAATGDELDSQQPTEPAEASTEAAFPVTIEHKYGSTEITEEPERIVTVGLTDHDAFLALGVAPVGTTDWYGDHPHAVWPWAQDELGDAEPTVVGNATELDLERIAALDPDVIVGLYTAMDEQAYVTLSEIAPTVAQPGGHVDYGIPWQELTLTAGQVVGRTGHAEQLVADVESRLASIREEHPEFVGATSSIAVPYEGIYVYSFNVANGRILSSLGLEQPEELAEMIGDADGTALSLERVDLIDLDVLVWLDAGTDMPPLDEDIYQQLDVHQEGREVFISSASAVGGAMSFSSVLSLPFLLDELVPMLELAIDGDPGTEVPSG